MPTPRPPRRPSVTRREDEFQELREAQPDEDEDSA